MEHHLVVPPPPAQHLAVGAGAEAEETEQHHHLVGERGVGPLLLGGGGRGEGELVGLSAQLQCQVGQMKRLDLEISAAEHSGEEGGLAEARVCILLLAEAYRAYMYQ